MTRLEVIILGMLSERPMTGYEVIGALADSPSFGARATAGSVYPALKRLISSGAVTSADATVGKKPASHFSLTARGIQDLEAWLNAPLSVGTTEATEDLLLRILFSQRMGMDKLRSLLESYHAGVRAQLAALEAQQAGWSNLPIRQRLCLRNGLASARAQVDWAEQALDELK